MDDVEKYCPEALWHLAQPLLPAHPERHQGGGRRRTDDRAMLAAIVYVLESGCSWRKLPGSFPVHWRTAHRRFAEWVRLGVMTALHQATLDVLGAAGRVDWSRASIDSMHVRALRRGDLTGPGPVDRGKPGSKIRAIGDRGGLPLHVDISAADVNDRRMLEDVVDGVHPVRQPVGRPRKRPAKLHGDKGYDYPECRELLRARNIVARIARKGIESSKRLGRHRYVIERCLEWTTRFRRLVRRYERKASHLLGFLRLACALICYRRADRLNLLTSNNPN